MDGKGCLARQRIRRAAMAQRQIRGGVSGAYDSVREARASLRALTASHPIKPTSITCRSARRPNPAEGPLIDAEKTGRLTPWTSRAHRRGSCRHGPQWGGRAAHTHTIAVPLVSGPLTWRPNSTAGLPGTVVGHRAGHAHFHPGRGAYLEDGSAEHREAWHYIGGGDQPGGHAGLNAGTPAGSPAFLPSFPRLT
jgi:hypothetical protein